MALRAISLPCEVTRPSPAGTTLGTRPLKGNQAFWFAELAVSWACSLSPSSRPSTGWEAGHLRHCKQAGRKTDHPNPLC